MGPKLNITERQKQKCFIMIYFFILNELFLYNCIVLFIYLLKFSHFNNAELKKKFKQDQ